MIRSGASALNDSGFAVAGAGTFERSSIAPSTAPLVRPMSFVRPSAARRVASNATTSARARFIVPAIRVVPGNPYAPTRTNVLTRTPNTAPMLLVK